MEKPEWHKIDGCTCGRCYKSPAEKRKARLDRISARILRFKLPNGFLHPDDVLSVLKDELNKDE